MNNPLKKLIRLRPEEGRTINSITTEYNISKETLRRWCNEFKEECQTQSLQFPNSVNEAEIMKENLRLRKEPAEKEKVILFLKKRRHSSQRKSIRGLSVYRPTS